MTPSVAAVAGWCGARTTSIREPLLGMPVGACHALPGRPVLPPLEPGAARVSEIDAICRLAPRLLCEPRRTSGAVGGAKERLTPLFRLETCSPESVLQPQSRTFDVNRLSAPSRARGARKQNRPDLAVLEHRVAFGGNGGRGWCGARTTSTRELLLGMPAGACHALPGRPVLPPLEPEAARFSEIAAICRLAPRLLCEQRRTSGAVEGAKARFTPHIRLETCSPGSVLQPQTQTSGVNRSSAPSRARGLLGLACRHMAAERHKSN